VLLLDFGASQTQSWSVEKGGMKKEGLSSILKDLVALRPDCPALSKIKLYHEEIANPLVNSSFCQHFSLSLLDLSGAHSIGVSFIVFFFAHVG